MLLPDKKLLAKIKFQFAGFVNFEKYSKTPKFNYEEKSVEEIFKQGSDPYFVTSIMHTIELSYGLLNNISLTTDAQKEIILSGWGVMGLWQLFAGETKNFSMLKNYFPLHILQANVKFTDK